MIKRCVSISYRQEEMVENIKSTVEEEREREISLIKIISDH